MSTTVDKQATTTGDTPAAAPAGSVGGSVREYVGRVRGGEVGALPALLGLVALVIVFTALRGSTFTNAFNLANLIHQAAAVIVIAMGLVFVLLLGEIDLSAGYTAGTAGAVMLLVVTRHGGSWVEGVLACLVTGAVIGFLIGLLVSKVGTPSFVVTLAAFLGLQGVALNLIGEGGTISLRNSVLLAVNNNDLPVWLGWVLAVAVIAVYTLVAVRRAAARRRTGLTSQPVTVVLAKALVLAVLILAATAYLSQERSRNAAVTSIKGVPIVMVLLVVLLVLINLLLTRTTFGRHVYAVGGNAEAARRAGISVARVKIICFTISSTLAGVGGILLASRDNSVSPSTGGADTLLYAVGAAVIGGTSLFGGKGRALDALLGGFVIAIIVNGMGLLNKPSSTVYIVTGLVLLIAATVDAVSRRRAAASGRI